MPLTLVVSPGVGQSTCCMQRPVQGGSGCPHTLGPPPPQPSVPLHSPQPSPIGPQFAPTSSQSCGMQPDMPPHTLGSPPPPQVSRPSQSPHSMMPPQPSPIGPQLAPTDSQVTPRLQPPGAASISPGPP